MAAVNIAACEKRALALSAHIGRQLCAVGGLACALQAHQHDDRGALGIGGELLVLGAHELGQLFVDDLDDHLVGGQTFENVGADAPLGGGLDEVLDHLIAHVRFKQGEADLAHGCLDVSLGYAALAAQLLERGG